MRVEGKGYSPRVGIAVVIVIAALVLSTVGRSQSDVDSRVQNHVVARTPLQQAEVYLKLALQRPTKLDLPKSTKPIPTGKFVVYIHCGVPACTVLADAAQAAAKILGWRYQTITTNGSPESVKKGWATAVRLGADVVLSSGYDRSIFSRELAQLVKRGGIAALFSTLTPPSDDIPVSTGLGKDVGREGEASAAWVVSNTKGKANTLYVNLPSFTTLKPIQDAFKIRYGKWCPGCKLKVMDIAITDIGPTATSRIIATLRSNSDINYVVFSNDALGIGFPAALRAAGLDKRVKFVGHAPSVENLGYVAAGQEAAAVNLDYYAIMATLIDGAARKMTGQPVAPANNALSPVWVETKGHIVRTNGFGPVMPDFYGQLRTIWLKK